MTIPPVPEADMPTMCELLYRVADTAVAYIDASRTQAPDEAQWEALAIAVDRFKTASIATSCGFSVRFALGPEPDGERP